MFGHFVTSTVFLILSVFWYDYRVVLFLCGMTGDHVQQEDAMGWLPAVRRGFSPSQQPHNILYCQSFELISVTMIGVHCPFIVSTCISLMTMRQHFSICLWTTLDNLFCEVFIQVYCSFPYQAVPIYSGNGFYYYFFLNSLVSKIDDQRVVKMICGYKIMSLIF